jgi:outer membrane protein OmpA-like peptidoglycan-associated protein
VTLVLCGLAMPGLALDLALPFNGQMTTRVVTAPDSHALAIGPYAQRQLPVIDLEGQVERQAFRLPGNALTTLQLVEPLRAQLTEAGFSTVYDCHAAACGGFDFRFATEVLPAPDMYVDLTDFRYLAVRRNAGDHIGLLVSASASAGFVQIIRVTTDPDAAGLRVQLAGDPPLSTPPPDPTDDPAPGIAAPPAAAVVQPAPSTSLPEALVTQGHAILPGLNFATGSARLSDGDYPALEALAAFLLADPSRRVALVGHTDAVGALPGNIALSRERAASVRERLIGQHGVPAGQLDAEGMGYLAPVAPNSTAEGREANRRVEAVLLNTQ